MTRHRINGRNQAAIQAANGRMAGSVNLTAINGPTAPATITPPTPTPRPQEIPLIVPHGKYLIEDAGMCTVIAWTFNPSKHQGKGKRIGYLTWFPGQVRRNPDGTYDDSSNINGGVIHKAYVSGPYRRKGIASAMLEHARSRYPDKEIRHSNALTDDGNAWAQSHP